MPESAAAGNVKPTMPRRGNVRDEHAAVVLASDARTLAKALGRTFGPDATPVLYANAGGRALELLDDSAVLARRLTDLPAGAMLLREMALSVRQNYGDGAATSILVADALLDKTIRLVAGGANPIGLKRGIDLAIDAATHAIDSMARPIRRSSETNVEVLEELAIGATGDERIGRMLAEMYDLLGPHAHVVVEERSGFSDGLELERFYIDGGRWRARPGISELIPEGSSELTLHDPLIAVADQRIDRAEDVIPILELGISTGRPVLLIARELEGSAAQILRANRGRSTIAVACLTSAALRLSEDLDDVALLSGASVLGGELGRPLRTLSKDDCGGAKWAVLHRGMLTLTRGSGVGTSGMDARVAELTGRAARLQPGDDEVRQVRRRLARLTSSLGVLMVGAATDVELDLRKAQISKAQRVLESALRDGVVPGAGRAYEDSIEVVLAVREDCTTDEEVWGVDAVAHSLTIPAKVLADRTPAAHAVVDAAAVVKGALRSAGSLAGAVLRTEKIVSAT